MNELESDIIKWHKETFPNATYGAILRKLHEELIEALMAKTQGDLISEIADVAIVAIAFFEREGMSLEFAINSKMAINQARQWGPEDETGNRVKISKPKPI
jgi:NTP pyrophosphatase (non-canonical NTP hydrolase)